MGKSDLKYILLKLQCSGIWHLFISLVTTVGMTRKYSIDATLPGDLAFVSKSIIILEPSVNNVTGNTNLALMYNIGDSSWKV
jgi:hypothetical protein